MKDGTCTWCSKEVSEQDFNSHAGEHYAKQRELMQINPRTTLTSVASASYTKEVPGSRGGTNF